MDTIHINPINADYYIIYIPDAKQLYTDQNLKNIYQNIGINIDDFDTYIDILFIKSKIYYPIKADRQENVKNVIYWKCSFIDKDDIYWIEHTESRTIYELLSEKLKGQNDIRLDDCLVIKVNDPKDLKIYDFIRKIGENINLCEIYDFFPDITKEADFKIIFNDEIKIVKYIEYGDADPRTNEERIPSFY